MAVIHTQGTLRRPSEREPKVGEGFYWMVREEGGGGAVTWIGGRFTVDD